MATPVNPRLSFAPPPLVRRNAYVPDVRESKQEASQHVTPMDDVPSQPSAAGPHLAPSSASAASSAGSKAHLSASKYPPMETMAHRRPGRRLLQHDEPGYLQRVANNLFGPPPQYDLSDRPQRHYTTDAYDNPYHAVSKMAGYVSFADKLWGKSHANEMSNWEEGERLREELRTGKSWYGGGEEPKREARKREGRSGPGATSSSSPILPPMLRSHIPMHTRQYFRFERSYESNWTYWSPFSTGTNYDQFWQYDGSTGAVAGAAYDTWACSFNWNYGDQSVAGNCPVMRLGSPAGGGTPLSPIIYGTSGANWGQACADLAILSNCLQYWSVPTIEIMIERLPENLNTSGTVNTAGAQPGDPGLSNESYGYFYIAPYGGEPGWYNYDEDAGVTKAGAPNKTNLTGGHAANMWNALQSDAFKYRKQFNRLAPGVEHPDYIHQTVTPTMPTFVTSTTSGGEVTQLQGYQHSPVVDIYDWANGTVTPQGFCFKVVWMFDAPLSSSAAQSATAASYSPMDYRVKFRMSVRAHGAQPFEDQVVSADILSARCKSSVDGVKATAQVLAAHRKTLVETASAQLKVAAVQLGQAPPVSQQAQPTVDHSDDDEFVEVLDKIKRQKLEPPPSSPVKRR